MTARKERRQSDSYDQIPDRRLGRSTRLGVVLLGRRLCEQSARRSLPLGDVRNQHHSIVSDWFRHDASRRTRTLESEWEVPPAFCRFPTMLR
jgi:hypothetical protein